MILPLVAGLLHYASFPPIDAWPLAFVSCVPLLVFFNATSDRVRIFAGVAVYCAVYAVLTLLFLLDPIILGWGIVVYITTLSGGILLIKRMKVRGVASYALMALAIFAAEYIAARFSLMPAFFVMSGIPLADTFFAGVARFGGVYATTLFVLAGNACIAYALSDVSRKRKAAALCSLGLLLAAGACVQFIPRPMSPLPARTMAVSVGDSFAVEQTIPDHALFVRSLLSPIGAAVEKEGAEVVVFPERMVNRTFEDMASPEALRALSVKSGGPLLSAYSEFAKEYGVSVVTTITTIDIAGTKHISTIVIDKDGTFAGIAHKRYLTIVSERWPFGSWLPALWRMELDVMPASIRDDLFIGGSATGQYESGELRTLSVAGKNFGALVCLEGQLPFAYRELKGAGAEYLVYTGSDVWIPLLRGSYQSLSTKLRQLEAISVGLPVVVSVRGGAPQVILPDGTRIEGPSPSGHVPWTYLVY